MTMSGQGTSALADPQHHMPSLHRLPSTSTIVDLGGLGLCAPVLDGKTDLCPLIGNENHGHTDIPTPSYCLDQF